MGQKQALILLFCVIVTHFFSLMFHLNYMTLIVKYS